MDGVLTVPFADDDVNTQVPFGSSNTLFLVLHITTDASAQIPDDLRITHQTESSSSGEDAEFDLPLVLEFAANVSSSEIEINDAPIAQPADLAGNVLQDNGAGADSDEELDELDELSATLIDPPLHGSLVGGLATTGDFIYRPEAGLLGQDSFSYQVSDGLATSATVTVTLSIVPAPFFTDDFETGDLTAWSSSSP